MPTGSQGISSATSPVHRTGVSPTATERTMVTLQGPTPTPTPIAAVEASSSNLVITEVMGNPCGGDPANEYIELYNFSDRPVSLQGLWLTDGQAAKQIVPGEERFSGKSFGGQVDVQSEILAPGKFALILAPAYVADGHSPYMPYVLPPSTLILTVSKGKFIGDDNYGISVTGRDVIVLYHGSGEAIGEVISTYGSPVLSGSPLSVKDDGKDGIPFVSNKCWSAERINAVNEDKEYMWREKEDGTPGYGDYNSP